MSRCKKCNYLMKGIHKYCFDCEQELKGEKQ